MLYSVAAGLMIGPAVLPLSGEASVLADNMRVAGEATLSTTGSTRGTAYGSANKIIALDGRLHAAWLDTKSATMVATLDLATGAWSEPVHIGSGLDNHGGPAMCADSQGYLHIVFGPHHGPLQYSRSARPNDASEWIAMEPFGDHCTYPSLICGADDTLYCAYRGRTAPFRLLFQSRPAGGEWSEPRTVVDAEVPGGYTQFGNSICLGPGGALHLGFHVYDTHPDGGKAVGHLQSRDGGETWQLANGDPVQLPFGPSKPGWVVKGPEYDMRCWTVDCDADGNPYLCVHKARPKMTLEVWKHTEDGWQVTDLAPILQAAYPGYRLTQGTLCFSDSGELYVAAAAALKGGWSAVGNEVFLFRSHDRGASFDVAQLSETNPSVPNWMPSIERHTGHNLVPVPHLMYTHGERGEGCTPSDVTQIRLVTLAGK